jgi:hypothetical protein
MKVQNHPSKDRQDRRRVEKKSGVQKGLAKLDEFRRNGWQRPAVGLNSEE